MAPKIDIKKLSVDFDIIKNILLIIFLVAVTFVSYDLTHNQNQNLKNASYIGIAITGFLSSVIVFLPAPATAILVLLILNSENKLLAIFSAALGSTIGELTGYLFGNSSREILNKIRIWNKNFSFLPREKVINKYFDFFLFLFAFIPNPLFDFIGAFAGYYKYDIKKFFLIVLFAKILRFVIVSDLFDFLIFLKNLFI
ncbi:MAG: VTT domain-containing protein [Candidatus Aenigmatarchaeota archaeon]